MTTFIEYLTESALMSTDAMKQSLSKFDKLALGKNDGSKPGEKRAKQIHKRADRKAGRNEEDEETDLPAIRDRNQGITNAPKERGKQRPSSNREFQRMKRRVRRTRGIGSDAKDAMPIDEL